MQRVVATPETLRSLVRTQVISQLHRGRKRLVFCDSRTRVEELALLLRVRKVKTFVSHSSLGLEERRDAERAFSEADDCVIVATSTLELGIDVGDLDHVIQVDAPKTVASLLQRLGRTGRRPGTVRSCLCLAVRRDALVCRTVLEHHPQGRRHGRLVELRWPARERPAGSLA